jgi:hypothetical protein
VASACAPGPSFAAAYRSRPDLATRTGCPLGPERSVVVLTQAFERGQLLRLDEARQAYVLLTGGRFWTVTLDFSREPFALSGFGTPPAGLLAPDKLFGRLWRDPKISQTLGWALSAERSFTGILQETMRAILLLDDQRRVQVLFHEGSFLTVTP